MSLLVSPGFGSGSPRFKQQPNDSRLDYSLSPIKKTQFRSGKDVCFRSGLDRFGNQLSSRMVTKKPTCPTEIIYGRFSVQRDFKHKCINYYDGSVKIAAVDISTSFPSLQLCRQGKGNQSEQRFLVMAKNLPLNCPYQQLFIEKRCDINNQHKHIILSTQKIDDVINILLDIVKSDNLKEETLDFTNLLNDITDINQTAGKLASVLKALLKDGGTVLHKVVTLLTDSYNKNATFWDIESTIIQTILSFLSADDKASVLQTPDAAGVTLQAKCEAMEIPI